MYNLPEVAQKKVDLSEAAQHIINLRAQVFFFPFPSFSFILFLSFSHLCQFLCTHTYINTHTHIHTHTRTHAHTHKHTHTHTHTPTHTHTHTGGGNVHRQADAQRKTARGVLLYSDGGVVK
jgi:hypothetical protein